MEEDEHVNMYKARPVVRLLIGPVVQLPGELDGVLYAGAYTRPHISSA